VIGKTIASSRGKPGLPPAFQKHSHGEKKMKDTMLKLYIKMQNLKSSLMQEEGQDLVEYALVVALIALAATAGMRTLASDINNAFTGIGTTLNTDM
jgi:pilus assembly protein Flp/PilA